MTTYLKAWQCIGCGTLDADAACIGICQDRKVELAYASDHLAALAVAKTARQDADGLARLLRDIANTSPRNGQWERSYRAFQGRARQALADIASDRPV